jgi:hypothetical protein
LKVAVDEETNPVPPMVTACGVDPAASEAGDSDVIVGTGLLAVTVKFTAVDEPPPGAGLVTTTG